MQLRRGFDAVALRAAEAMARDDRCGRTLTSLLYRPGVSMASVERVLRLRRASSEVARRVLQRLLALWAAHASAQRTECSRVRQLTSLGLAAELRRAWCALVRVTRGHGIAMLRPGSQEMFP